ncbi:MAG: hypothetical protein CMJ83_16035 [Planctomycetes bacterium]|nr:hypothetical protein [Planctomycetota bacterium]
MYALIKAIRGVLKSLNGDATPASCAAAVLFGCLVGLVPFGMHTVLFLCLLVVFRVPIGLGLIVGAGMTLLRLALLQWIGAPLGQALLAEGTATRAIIAALMDVPVVGLVPFEMHAVTGGLVMAVGLGVLLWYPTLRAVRGYRSGLRGKLTGSKTYEKVAWLFGRPPEEDREWGRFSFIRWKLVAGVVAVVFLAGWLGAPMAVDRAVSSALESALAEEADLGDVSCSIFSGEVTIEGLRVGGLGEDGRETLTAKRARADISVLDLLRRRIVIEEVELVEPRMVLNTNAEGELEILENKKKQDEERGLDPEEIYEKAKETYGKIEEAKDWVQKARDLLAYLRAREDVKGDDPEAVAALLGYTEVTEVGPRFVVKSIKVTGLDIELEGSDAPDLRNFGFMGFEISSDPTRHAEPMSVQAAGLLGAARPATFLLKSVAVGDDGDLRVDLEELEFANVGVELLKPLLGDTLPFLLNKGTVAMRLAEGWIDGDGGCNLSANLVLKDIAVSPRPGVATLAGLPAAPLCSAVSDAGTFGLDVRITGSLFDPQVDVGNTMDLLTQMGAAAFRKMALQQLEARYPGMGKLLEGDGLLAVPGQLLSGEPIAGLDLGDVLQGGGLVGKDGSSPLSGLTEALGGGKDPGQAVTEALGGILGGKEDDGKKKDPVEGIKKGLGDLLGGKKDGGGKKPGGGKKDGGGKKPGGNKKDQSPLKDLEKGLGGLLGGKKGDKKKGGKKQPRVRGGNLAIQDRDAEARKSPRQLPGEKE